MPKELIIKVTANSGLEMENRLNKAIDDLGKVLTTRGFSNMELTGSEMKDEKIVTTYEVEIKDKI